jgi:hypothetical protein
MQLACLHIIKKITKIYSNVTIYAQKRRENNQQENKHGNKTITI